MSKQDEKSKTSNSLVAREVEIQKFWAENKIFEKTLTATKNGPVFSFFDGPPFATGTPHYGHLVASVMKDAVPRYQTMKGHYVERRWGWDCHGLPIENLVENELKIKSKKEIEEKIGVAKFNELCRSKVLSYVEDWKKIMARFGRWADMENAYKTMDLDYMESVWWVFKQLWDKNLIYEGYKSMFICPRCETTLSQQEVSEGYKDIKDISAIAKFKVKNPKFKINGDVFILAWTTTPWTLPANVALAVGAEIEYVLVHQNEEYFIVAKNRIENIFGDSKVEVAEEFKGKDLIGLKYEPLFPYYLNQDLKNKENLYTVVAADFVTTEDGTGVVHIAPAFGEEDMALGREKNLPFIQNVTMSGQFTAEVEDFQGLNVKPAGDTQATDVAIIKYLASKELLFAKEKYEHSYPHCWRCDTPLINYATSSWFVKVTAVKERALKLAKDINWSPAHIKEGRFGNWLEGARDWSISRQRFWASCLPIWQCECGEQKVFGSIKELRDASGVEITDLHKHKLDGIEIPCSKCGQKMKRVPDVLDTWFDSGSMPFAQQHYPFANEEKFKKSFPADFIAEGADQTRAWFYYLHIIATAVKNSWAYNNVIVNGIVLAEDGAKMSKRLKNYPEPDLIMEKYGADALRYYLLASPVMQTENLNFSEAGVKEAYQKVVMLLDNILNFYRLYAPTRLALAGKPRQDNILDQWLMAKLNSLIKETTEAMGRYDLPKAVRPIEEFSNEFSTWWLRRSRERFKNEGEDKENALKVFYQVLATLAKVMAPFTPFVAEAVYQAIGGEKESVHLEKWPKAEKADEKIISEMAEARKIVELGLASRAESGMKIRQPLSALKIKNQELRLSQEFLNLIKDELNVKAVEFDAKIEKEVELDLVITEDLKIEGAWRELIRTVNGLRKEAGLTLADTVEVRWQSDGEIIKKVFTNPELVEELKRNTIASAYQEEKNNGEEIEINGEKIKLEI